MLEYRRIAGLTLPVLQRTSGLGYAADTVRKQFTGYERDDETGLDFAKARYHNFVLGRFVSPDPLYFAASRLSDPQRFNLYVYVRNNPLVFVDPNGLDGARAVSAVDDKKDKVLTEEDRKALEKQLKRIAPGTKVLKDGTIKRPGFFRRIANALTGHSAGTRLVSDISKSNVTIRVNHFGAVDSRGVGGNNVNLMGGVAPGAIVNWDPNTRYSAASSNSAGTPVNQLASSAAILAHELIHAHNVTRAPGKAAYTPYDDPSYDVNIGGSRFRETVPINEQRAIGLGYNVKGDITENQIRRELGEAPRLAQGRIEQLINCSGSAAGSPICN